MTLGDTAQAAGRMLVRDVIAFPVWWYTEGAVYVLEQGLLWLRKQRVQLAIGLWMKNLFVPMYGQYDWQGRIMSVLIRGVQIFARSCALLVLVIGCMLAVVCYFLVPVLCIMLVVMHARLRV